MQPQVTKLISFTQAVSPQTCETTLCSLADGLLGIASIPYSVGTVSIQTQIMLTQNPESIVNTLRKNGGDFSHLEMYRALNGITLSRYIPQQ
jgi:hypothetical protein